MAADRLRTPDVDKFLEALLTLRDPDEVFAFLQDVATVREIQDLAQRLAVARMLDDGPALQRHRGRHRRVVHDHQPREPIAQLRRRRLPDGARAGLPGRAGRRPADRCPSSTSTPTPSTRCSTARRASTTLVDRAVELGMPALAITDHGYMYGAVEFYKTATKAGIKPIIGCEVYFTPGDRAQARQASRTSTTCCCSRRTTRATAT